MEYFIAGFLIFAASGLAMAVGMLFRGSPPAKSCGQLTTLSGRCHCQCGDKDHD